MSTIYQTIDSIKFFDYTATFVGVARDVPEVTMTVPYNTYRLEVRNSGVIHAVTWKDAYKPTTVEADRLRNLFSMVLGFIHEHPDFKRLPPPLAGCA